MNFLIYWPFIALFIYGIIIIGVIFIMRAVFSIPSIVKNLKVQTKLLSEMAKVQGVSTEVIDEIKREAGYND